MVLAREELRSRGPDLAPLPERVGFLGTLPGTTRIALA